MLWDLFVSPALVPKGCKVRFLNIVQSVHHLCDVLILDVKVIFLIKGFKRHWDSFVTYLFHVIRYNLIWEDNFNKYKEQFSADFMY